MPIFRRDNDGRRVVKFPDKATAQQTISMIANSGALSGGGRKPSNIERAATRSEIKDIQADAKTLADANPKSYAARNPEGEHDIWNDNKPNFEATREAQVWPSKDSPTGKPGLSEYKKAPPSESNKPKDPWA